MSERIVFLDRATIAQHIELAEPSFEHSWREYDRTSADQVAERLGDATIAILNKAPVSAETLAAAPDLRMISVAATGTDIIDLDACRERGVVVSNVRGYAIRTVPEHVFALMLALKRSLVGYRDDVADGEWQRQAQFCFFNYLVSDLYANRLGIVGGGSLGSAVAAIARGFGMDPVFAGRPGQAADDLKPGYLPFDEVIETSDVLTLHCPLTDQTRAMMNADVFQRMKRTAVLINTARGALIDDADLVRALDEGWIAAAGIDVLDKEPPTEDHPLYQLIGRPNFLLTPHMGWASTEAMQDLAGQVISNIENFVAGEPSNVVT